MLKLFSMTGKTTRLIEEAVMLLADLPETSGVYITGAHPQWLHDLSQSFKMSGLVGVYFFTPSQIRNGALQGRRGILLIDDFFDLRWEDRQFLLMEKKLLRP